jgi:glycosyltransferase involved in cell wall biosynthesis
MKLIILHPTLPAYRKDFFETLNQHLKQKDIELTVIHGTCFYNKSINLDTDPTYSAIPLLTKEFIFLGYRIVWWKGILNKIKRIDPDMVIILFTPGNLTFLLVQLYCYIRKIKIGIWSNGSVRKEITGIRRKIRGFVNIFFLYRADVHICYGTRYKKELLALGIDESKVVVAQNTINIEKILSFCVDNKHDSSGEFIKFLSVGVLIKDKNLDLAIRTISRLNREGYKVHFNIIGKGAIIEELRSLVREEKMEENIFVLGYKSNEEVPSFFLSADVFLLTGTGGLAVNEAMAYGLPILSTMADGTIIDLLFEGKNGYYLNDDASLENIYEVCKKILKNSKTELMEMGNFSRQIIREKATLHNMVNNFEKAILYGMGKPVDV